MADLPPDPITLTHHAIWDALLASEDWKACFAGPTGTKVANWVRFDAGKAFPGKANLGTYGPADGPFVALLQGRFTFLPSVNSVAVGLVQSYPLVVGGADLNAAPFNGVKWQTMRALCRAGDALGLPNLVRGWTVTDGQDDAFHGPREWAKGQARWLSTCNVNVEMTVSKTAVAAGLVPTA